MRERIEKKESSRELSRAEIARSLNDLLEDIDKTREKIFKRSADSIVNKDDHDRYALESKLVQTQEQTIARHARVLESLGLECEVEESNLGLRTKEGETWNLPHIVLYVENAEKFVSYLRSLDATKLASLELNSLITIIEKLRLSIDESLNPKMIEFFGNISKIATEYERLGKNNSIIHSYNDIKKYIEPVKGKYLKEYLLARSANILPRLPNEGFGPDVWQRDSTLDTFRNKYWMPALSALEKISQNPNASGFFQILAGYLKTSVDYARAEVIRISKRDGDYAERTRGFVEVLDEAEISINSLESIKKNVKSEIKTES